MEQESSLSIYKTRLYYPIHYEKLVKFQIEIIIFQQYTINQLAKKIQVGKIMKEFYSINELAVMTGFTTRSLRYFIQMEFLKGDKVNGEWQFSTEQIESFFSNPNIKQGLVSKANSVVYDFLLNQDSDKDKMCSILNLNLNNEEANMLSEKICSIINNSGKQIEFKFMKTNQNVKIIISGEKDFVKNLLNQI